MLHAMRCTCVLCLQPTVVLAAVMILKYNPLLYDLTVPPHSTNLLLHLIIPRWCVSRLLLCGCNGVMFVF